MNTKSSLAQKIKSLRNSRKLTQTQLANYTGLSMSAIRSYENGLREPNSKAMVALESYFHVTGEYLRGEVDTAVPVYVWEDREIMEAVKDSFPGLIDKLLKTSLRSSECEQKMLFDILVELLHMASLKDISPEFRSASFFLMEEVFTLTTRFIDLCHSSITSDFEDNRIEKSKISCIEDFENAISKFKDDLKK